MSWYVWLAIAIISYVALAPIVNALFRFMRGRSNHDRERDG